MPVVTKQFDRRKYHKRLDEIRTALYNGMTVAEAAEHLSVPKDKLYAIAQAYNFPINPHLSVARREQLRGLFEIVPIEALTQEFRHSRASILRICGNPG